MDFSEAKDLVGWIIGLFASSFIAIVIGVINIIKSGKMIPRDIKGADLTNKSKEVSIADQYGKLATDAAEKALRLQERLNAIEDESISMQGSFNALQEQYSELKDKIEKQEIIIADQAKLILEQSKRLDMQDSKIKEQQEEIVLLRSKLEISEKRNAELIKQIQENGNGLISTPLQPVQKAGKSGNLKNKR